MPKTACISVMRMVRAESFEIPAEARGVLGVENQIVVAPVVFERPHFAPNRLAVRSDRAALAARGYDFVLTERPRADVADCADTAPLVLCAVRLGAVFDNEKIVSAGDVHDCVHVAGEAHEVDGDYRLCLRSDELFDFGGHDILRI